MGTGARVNTQIYRPEYKEWLKAADEFGFSYPDGYEKRFTESHAILDSKQKFLVSLADSATKCSIDYAIKVVDAIAKKVDLPLTTESCTNEIYECFKKRFACEQLVNDSGYRKRWMARLSQY